jgi:DNA-binding phage protein
LRHKGVPIANIWGQGFNVPEASRGRALVARRIGLTPDAQAVRARLRREIVRTGWTETARRTGYARGALHRAFAGAPGRQQSVSFNMIAGVAQALGFDLRVTPRAAGL